MALEKSKISGMLLGLHAGDSLGATIEFLPPSAAWNTHTEIIGGGEFHWKPGEATDDTDLMLCVLKSIESKDKFNFETLKAEMLAWYHSKPPDIGNTTKKGLARLEAGDPLRECGFVDNGFQGNGSIMRVAPLSLMSKEALGHYQEEVFPSLLDLMITQTKMTHGHQHCVDCDVIFVAALKRILAGDSKDLVFSEALQVAKDISPLIARRLEEIPRTQWDGLKTSGFCVDTLCAGLWAFMKCSSFEKALVAVVNRGDDADSCGAVAGALCGAFYGEAAIPERWLKTLELRDVIRQQIDRLARVEGPRP